MAFGFLGPWVNFGSTTTKQADVPSEWLKTVVAVSDPVDPVLLYQETIVERGQTDKSRKQ